MRVIGEFCGLAKEIASDTAKLCGDLIDISVKGFGEFLDHPLRYTVESVQEVAEAAGSMSMSDCKQISVKPVKGSVVYCRILGGVAEHSGVYVGKGRIVHLNGNGFVERVSAEKFTQRLDGLSFSSDIYVSSRFDKAVGSKQVAKRAVEMIGDYREYNVLCENCHQFVSGCLTGDFENSDCYMWALKQTCKKVLSSDAWCVYKRK
jgi:hypothetical protein